MKCPKCGLENPTNSKICAKCGTQLTNNETSTTNSVPSKNSILCPNCGTFNNQNNSYCNNCGQNLNNGKKPVKDNHITKNKNLLIIIGTIIIVVLVLSLAAFVILTQNQEVGDYVYTLEGYHFNIPNNYVKDNGTGGVNPLYDSNGVVFSSGNNAIYITIFKDTSMSPDDYLAIHPLIHVQNTTMRNINGYYSNNSIMNDPKDQLFIFKTGNDLIFVQTPDNVDLPYLISANKQV